VDTGLHLRVLWRFRVLVAVGLVLATLLAILSFARLTFAGTPHLEYRQQEQWQGYTTLIVTPHGFPWGRSVFSEAADPARYASLALIYAQLVTSDDVKRIMLRQGPVTGHVEATYVSSTPGNSGGAPLPFIVVSGTGKSARAATALSSRAAGAFRTYLTRQQNANAIPIEKRVSASILNRTQTPVLLQGRSKTLPMVTFTGVLVIFVALAFILESLRPRIRVAASAETTVVRPAATARRSA
jgi:hypothetical protein